MENIHNGRIKYYIVQNEQISFLKVFIVDDKNEIYEAKIEIVDLQQDIVKYNVKYIKTNLVRIDMSLHDLGDEPICDIIEKIFLPFTLNPKIKSLFSKDFFNANLDIKQLRCRLKKIEESLSQYPGLSVAYFRILDSLLALLYSRNTLEMKLNITSFFILEQESKYKSPHNTVLEHCLLQLNRI